MSDNSNDKVFNEVYDFLCSGKSWGEWPSFNTESKEPSEIELSFSAWNHEGEFKSPPLRLRPMTADELKKNNQWAGDFFDIIIPNKDTFHIHGNSSIQEIYHVTDFEIQKTDTGPVAKLIKPLKLSVGTPILIINTATNSLASVYMVTSENISTRKIILGDRLFCAQGNLSQPPSKLAHGIVLPSTTPKIYLSTSVKKITPKDGDGKTLTLRHCQYWRKNSSSYAVPKGVIKRTIVEHSAGVTKSSSTQETLAISLGLDVSAGWGPISASISASLSYSSTTANGLILQDEVITTAEDIVRNISDVDGVVVYWELVDSVTIEENSNILASFDNAQSPPVSRSYPSDLKLSSPEPGSFSDTL